MEVIQQRPVEIIRDRERDDYHHHAAASGAVPQAPPIRKYQTQDGLIKMKAGKRFMNMTWIKYDCDNAVYYRRYYWNNI